MNQIAKIGHNSGVAGWSGRQLDTIRRTVARDTNDDEFNLFVEYCASKRLDPFVKQVIAIVFSRNDAEKRQMTIITTQDGLRVMAARCGDYRPEETEPEYEYDQALKGPTNPLGIVKCSVKLWKQDAHSKAWFPVNGTAYWDEFVPTKKLGTDGFEWVETGEFYPEGHAKAGKPKFRKKMLGEVKETIDDSGQWLKMPRNQIAKCARMQALRGGWPETFSGVYAQEEMDRAIAADLTASEMVEAEREQHRMRVISALEDEFAVVDAVGNLSYVPAGRYGDQILQMARLCETPEEIDAMRHRNRDGLQRFWAKHMSDALQIKKELEAIYAAAVKKVQA